MRNKLLVLIFIFTLLPVISWGQGDVTDIDLAIEGNIGYTIEKGGTYHFTGTFTGTPEQKINNSEKVKAVIYIKEGVTATIILEDVNISLNKANQCPLCAGDAKDITLKIKGTNTLSTTNSNGNSPGLWIPEGEDSKITIQNENEENNGTLTVQGAYYFPGIGLDLTGQESHIIIKSGIVNATGDTSGAGIEVSDNMTLVIEGGIVTAKGGLGGAGIGGGEIHTGGTCIITAGIVTTEGGSGSAGIGGGVTCAGGTCIITGGIVTAKGGYGSAGIGNGADNFGTSTFSTKDDQGNSGNGFIITSSITDNNAEKKKDWSGVIFEDTNGKVYGESVILTTDVLVPEGKVLEIESGKTLTINDEFKLENKGTIINNGKIANKGAITNNGTITNNGKILNVDGGTISDGTLNGNKAENGYEVTYKFNNNDATTDVTKYVAYNSTLPTDIFTRLYYHIEGWYEETGCSNKVEKITGKITVYAKWELNTFTVNKAVKQELTYKQAMEEYDLSTLLSPDAVADCGAITYTNSSDLPSGLLLNGSIISGTPNEATTDDSKVTITATAANTSSQEIKVIFSVAKAELTVTPNSDQVVYEDDKILYTVTGKPTDGAEPKFKGTLKVDESGNVIEGKDFKLVDESAKNYSYTITSGIPATICSGKAKDAVATTQETAGESGWYKENITLIPPADFKIALDPLVSPTALKSDLTYAEELVWETEGNHTLTYSLQRKSNSSVYEHTIFIKLDKTPPALSYTTDNLNYTLTFSDAGSGIDELFVDDTKVTLAPDATTYTATGTAGTHKARVTDKAGLSKDISFKLEDGGSVDPPPTPEPDPDPVYYDITLPETEGVTFSPEAGTHPVEEYSSFSFSLVVAEGYRLQSIPVVKANGIVITPNANGQYKLTWISSNQSITVEGILADTPTANETLGTPAFELRTEGHTLCITLPKPSLCRLFDPSGRLICSRQLTPGINRLEGLAAGIYFVVVEREGVQKIVVQ